MQTVGFQIERPGEHGQFHTTQQLRQTLARNGVRIVFDVRAIEREIAARALIKPGVPARVTATIRFYGTPSHIAGLPFTDHCHRGRREPCAAKHERTLHERENHEAFAERAPFRLRQRRAREQRASADALPREKRLPVRERRINVRRLARDVRELATRHFEARERERGAVVGVRERAVAFVPVRHAEKILPGIFDSAPRKSERAGAALSAGRKCEHRTAAFHKGLKLLRHRIIGRGALPHDERHFLPPNSRCTRGRDRFCRAIRARFVRRSGVTQTRAGARQCCNYHRSERRGGAIDKICRVVAGMIVGGQFYFSPAAGLRKFGHVKLQRLPLHRRL